MRDVVTVAATSSDGLSAPDLDAFAKRLPEHEQDRATAMRLESRRRNFVLGRVLLRAAVARVADVRPEHVGVEIEPSGRPVLTGPLSSFFVSIAHSGSDVIVGIAKRPIGVDVEQLRHLAMFRQVAARVCSPDELRLLAEMSDTDRERAFMTVWARKEAYGKAIGRGIAFPLRTVTVGVSGSIISGASGNWHVADLDVDPRSAAAVVAHGTDWRAQLDRVECRTL
jgi:4'-phosphopantetheinyl transferase